MCVCVCLGLLAEELKSYGIQDVFVFCTRGELSKYRVPNLLDLYQQSGIVTHHHPIPDGGTPDIGSCWEIMEELATCLKSNRKTLIQYVLLPLDTTPATCQSKWPLSLASHGRPPAVRTRELIPEECQHRPWGREALAYFHCRNEWIWAFVEEEQKHFPSASTKNVCHYCTVPSHLFITSAYQLFS